MALPAAAKVDLKKSSCWAEYEGILFPPKNEPWPDVVLDLRGVVRKNWDTRPKLDGVLLTIPSTEADEEGSIVKYNW